MFLEKRYAGGMFVFLIALLTTPAAASRCSSAIARHDAVVQADARWFTAEMRKVFGTDPKNVDWNHPDACVKSLPIFRQRVVRLEESVGTYHAFHQACPRAKDIRNKYDTPLNGSVEPPTLLELTHTAIRECEKQIAETALKPAPEPQPVETVRDFEAKTQSGTCGSDITGTGGAKKTRTDCKHRKIGMSCGGTRSTQDCLTKAQWTDTQPYNHGPEPVVFSTFAGDQIMIKVGETLWSIADTTSPTRRHLESRKWSGQVKNLGRCDTEYLDAPQQDFVVRFECEIERQEALQREFEMREEYAPYLLPSDCKAPGVIQWNEGWERKDLGYWKNNPKEPVGWCIKPSRDGRQDSYPIRETNWHTVKECSEDILGTALPIGVNSRGVRGCKFKE
jgi:hypothetical protein